MDATPADAFARITTLARANFDQVKSLTDFTPERAVLRLSAAYGVYRVVVTELISQVFLTEDMTFEAFVDWLKANVKPHGKGESDWTGDSN